MPKALTQELDESAPSGNTLKNRLKATIATIKANKKQFFWYWVIYQCIKGILTTSLIWIPLLYVWLGMN